MSGKSLDDVSEADLRELITNGVREGKKLEYKQELTINNDSGKKEFLADCSSFANTVGGHLIYGMNENNGIPIELVGLDIKYPDHEINRLENLIKSGIEPRMNRYEIQAKKLSNSKYVILIEIGQSWISPHRVILKGHDKFYSRTSIGKFPMDVNELKLAFTITENIAEKIRNFRIDRISSISTGSTAPKAVIHLIPLNSFSKGEYNLPSLPNDWRIISKLIPMWCYSHGCHYNADGLRVFCHPRDQFGSYVQLFREGIIEATVVSYSNNNEKNIHSIYNEEEIVSYISQYLEVLNELNVDTPIFIFLTLTGVKGYKMPRRSSNLSTDETKIDRDVLLLTNVVLENYDNKVENLLKPIFDAMWNACGFEKSDKYDKKGEWIG